MHKCMFLANICTPRLQAKYRLLMKMILKALTFLLHNACSIASLMPAIAGTDWGNQTIGHQPPVVARNNQREAAGAHACFTVSSKSLQTPSLPNDKCSISERIRQRISCVVNSVNNLEDQRNPGEMHGSVYLHNITA